MASSSDDLSLVDCPVCLDSFLEESTEPKVLKCGHTVCSVCLLNLVKANQIECPTCRQKTKSSKQEISQLPTNYNLKGLPEVLVKVDRMCQVCLRSRKQQLARFVCTDCNRRYCEGCAIIHNDTPIFSSHKMISCSQKPANSCQNHGETVQFVCNVCQVGICTLCLFEADHRKHVKDITTLSVFIKLARVPIEAAKEALKTSLTLLDNCTCKLEADLLDMGLDSGNINKAMILDDEKREKYQETINRITVDIEGRHKELEQEKRHLREVKQDLDELEIMVEWDMEAIQKANTMKELAQLVVLESWKKMHETYYKANFESLEIVIEKCIPTPALAMIVSEKKDPGREIFSREVITLGEESGAFLSVESGAILGGESRALLGGESRALLGEESPGLLSGESAVLFGEESGALPLSYPSALHALDDESVLITDLLSSCAYRFSVTGQLLKVYRSKNMQTNNPCLSVFQNKLFMASPDIIVQIDLETGNTELEHKPRVHIHNVCVISFSKIIIVQCVAGELIQFDPKTGRKKTVVEGLDNPTDVKVVENKDVVQYVAFTPGGTTLISVFDENWRFCFALSPQFPIPNKSFFSRLFNQEEQHQSIISSTVALKSNGNYLLPDTFTNSIFEINQDGELVGEVIKSSTLNRPIGVAFSSPFLWVLEANPYKIQAFNI